MTNAGTILLDALVNDRPAVCVLYDEGGGPPAESWAAKSVIGEHYRDVAASGAFHRAGSFDEVVAGIERSLAHPDELAEERRRVVEVVVGRVDGHAADRVVDAVLEAVDGSGGWRRRPGPGDRRTSGPTGRRAERRPPALGARPGRPRVRKPRLPPRGRRRPRRRARRPPGEDADSVLAVAAPGRASARQVGSEIGSPLLEERLVVPSSGHTSSGPPARRLSGRGLADVRLSRGHSDRCRGGLRALRLAAHRVRVRRACRRHAVAHAVRRRLARVLLQRRPVLLGRRSRPTVPAFVQSRRLPHGRGRRGRRGAATRDDERRPDPRGPRRARRVARSPSSRGGSPTSDALAALLPRLLEAYGGDRTRFARSRTST